MEMHRPPLPLLKLRAEIKVFLPILFAFCLVFAGAARTEGSGPETAFPTHREFVESGLDSLVGDLLTDFPFQRGKPVFIVSSGPDAARDHFEMVLASHLMDRGLMIRSSGAAADGAAVWTVRYRFARLDLLLTDPSHRSIFGRIWLKRTFHVALSVDLAIPGEDSDLWSQAIDTTFADRIPKARLGNLEDADLPLYSPPAPTTTLERLGRPLTVAAAAGTVLAILLVVM